jgi:hypothetical protein
MAAAAPAHLLSIGQVEDIRRRPIGEAVAGQCKPPATVASRAGAKCALERRTEERSASAAESRFSALVAGVERAPTVPRRGARPPLPPTTTLVVRFGHASTEPGLAPRRPTRSPDAGTLACCPPHAVRIMTCVHRALSTRSDDLADDGACSDSRAERSTGRRIDLSDRDLEQPSTTATRTREVASCRYEAKAFQRRATRRQSSCQLKKQLVPR